MTGIWLANAEHVDLGIHGGPFVDAGNPKLLWHTWEGTNLAAAEAAYRPYPPHIGVDLPNRRIRQYVSLDLHSYALLSSASEAHHVIQVEVSGFAHDTRHMSDEDCDWLGVNIARPIHELCGVPPIVCPQGFHDDTEGISPAIASSASHLRFTPAAFTAFTGHCGHQHAPAPDSHWDPGAWRIDRILAAAADAPAPPPAHPTPTNPQPLEESDVILLSCSEQSDYGEGGIFLLRGSGPPERVASIDEPGVDPNADVNALTARLGTPVAVHAATLNNIR